MSVKPVRQNAGHKNVKYNLWVLKQLLMLLFQDKWRKISEDNYYEMDKYLNQVNIHLVPLGMFKTTF